MTELTTTVQCACGNKIKILIMGDDPFCSLVVSDGDVKLIERGPATVEYKFVCNKCLGGEK